MSINRIIPARHISLPDFDLFGHALNSLFLSSARFFARRGTISPLYVQKKNIYAAARYSSLLNLNASSACRGVNNKSVLVGS